jgi:hypothetical protein
LTNKKIKIMKKTIKMVAGIIILGLVSCSESSDPKPSNGGGNPTTKSKMELVMGKWVVDQATHDGDPDGSSLNKTVTIEANGVYNYNGSWNGTYMWSQDSTVLHLDAGSQYSQDWIIEKLTEEEFDVDFFSPFTGKPARWEMVSTW